MNRILETKGTFVIQEGIQHVQLSLYNLLIDLIYFLCKKKYPITWITPRSLGEHPLLKNNLYFSLDDAQAALKLYLSEDKIHII